MWILTTLNATLKGLVSFIKWMDCAQSSSNLVYYGRRFLRNARIHLSCKEVLAFRKKMLREDHLESRRILCSHSTGQSRSSLTLRMAFIVTDRHTYYNSQLINCVVSIQNENSVHM